jgi:transcriptional regulator with XRE-family HTH domain
MMQTFARRLHELMVEKDLSQADVARRAFGTETTKEGYTVAKGRDRISAYLSGRTYPESRTIKVLADALMVKPEDLAPEAIAAAVDRDNPSLSITMVEGHPDKVHLVVNQLVPLNAAMEIGSILARIEKGA